MAKSGVPLPGGSRIWASNWPPPGNVYAFVFDVEQYPQQIVNVFVIAIKGLTFVVRFEAEPLIGLFLLRYRKPTPDAVRVVHKLS